MAARRVLCRAKHKQGKSDASLKVSAAALKKTDGEGGGGGHAAVLVGSALASRVGEAVAEDGRKGLGTRASRGLFPWAFLGFFCFF